MNKTPLEIMQKRYEQVRTLCLRYADLHESSTAVCHQALGIAKHSDHLAVELAAVLDDAMLALLASEEQRKKLEQQLRDVDSTSSSGSVDRGDEPEPTPYELATELVAWAQQHGDTSDADDLPEMLAIRDNTVIVCKELLRLSALVPPERPQQETQHSVENAQKCIAGEPHEPHGHCDGGPNVRPTEAGASEEARDAK